MWKRKMVMKTYNIFKVILLTAILSNALAISSVIPNIHIESQGNNKFEAKIKANKFGMRQSIKLLLDKINVKSFDPEQMTLVDLHKTCKISTIDQEKSADHFYSANVSYACDFEVLKKMLKNHANPEKIESFYNTIVIPVLKKGSKYLIWDKSSSWYKDWRKHNPALAKSKILLSEPNASINPENILKLNYQDIVKAYPNKLFSRASIVICDFFEKNNTTSYVRIKYKNLDEQTSNTNVEEYEDLSLNPDNLSIAFDEIISDFIVKNGNINNIEDEDLSWLAQEQETSSESITEQAKYTLYLEGYDQYYVADIKAIISKIPEIKHSNFEPEGLNLWKVELLGNFKSEEDFAECLYINGLTYRQNKNYITLIKLDPGA